MRLIIVWFFLLSSTLHGFANDSTAEVSVGGLALNISEVISLDSEDLYISRDEVRVNYRFTNRSDRDVETLVAFPLPDQAYGTDIENFYRDLVKDLDFKTTVDGKQIDYQAVVQPIFKGQDITDKLKAAGLPFNLLENADDFSRTAASLPETMRKALLQEGLLAVNGEGNEAFYWGKWAMRTSITRKQIFPAGKTISVQHRYKPLAGGSVGGTWTKPDLKDDWVKIQIKKYCVEESWLAALAKKDAQLSKREYDLTYSELWLGYVLKSGANWQGPIRDFRLVVDKGKPDSLVSFCAEGVKKISPTQFEVRKKNFEPTQDLNILIIDWRTSNEQP